VIDLGPGAGVNGGRVVAEGSVKALLRCTESITVQCLVNPLLVHLRTGKPAALVCVEGAHLHNLKQIDVEVPRRRRYQLRSPRILHRICDTESPQ